MIDLMFVHHNGQSNQSLLHLSSDHFQVFTVSPLLPTVALLMLIRSLGGSSSCAVLTGRHDGYPSIIRACCSAPRPVGPSQYDIY